MDISSYNDLLKAVKSKPVPQHMLFVFTSAELPDDATEEEKMQFERQEAGALAPVLCGDKPVGELENFELLLADADQAGKKWDVMFVSSIAGEGDVPPATSDVEQFMKVMLEAIKKGKVSRFAAFNRKGEILQINRNLEELPEMPHFPPPKK